MGLLKAVPPILLIIAVLLVFYMFMGTETGQPLDNLESVTVTIRINGNVELADKSTEHWVDWMKLETPTYPENSEFQGMRDLTVSEPHETKKDYLGNTFIEITFREPQFGDNPYTVESTVTGYKRQVLPKNASGTVEQIYSKPSEYVQSDNPEIIALANEITQGSADKYAETMAITRWVHENVQYSNEFLYEAKGAVWTYENRVGACDEYTHLELALLRARGIPARYVYGVAPEDYPYGWQRHSWVEAYVGGWIPVDPTWGEYDYVDAAHIKFAVGPDEGYMENKVTASGAGLLVSPLSTPQLDVVIIEEKYAS